MSRRLGSPADFIIWMRQLEIPAKPHAIEPVAIKLEPLPVWKWSIAVFLLLIVPVLILIQQASEAFSSTAEMARSEIGQQLEGLSSRIALEMSTTMQMREILNDFHHPYAEASQKLYYLTHFRRLCRTLLPVEAVAALQLIEAAQRTRLAALEKQLRRLVPGIKLLKWDSEYRVMPDSDDPLPRWAYHRIVETLKKRITRGPGEKDDRSYLESIPMLTRNFLDSNQITMFMKSAAEVFEFSDASGHRVAMYWENDRIAGFYNDHESGAGFLAVVDLEVLPRTFAFDMIMRRKGHEWKHTGIEPGWLIEPKPGRFFLPYPFLPIEHEYWAKWLFSRPNGIHEHRGIIISVRRVDGGITLITARSSREIDRTYGRSIFLLLLLLATAMVMPAIVVLGCRKNQGMAISIRWQIIALFVLTMALPSAVLFHLGSELLKDRQRIYENDAFKVLEGIKKNLEENTDFAFRHLEKLSGELGNRLMALKFAANGRFVDHDKARALIEEYSDKTSLTAVYMLDSGADMLFNLALDNSTGKDMVPLVQSIAKIKLRYTGNLKLRGKSADVGMVDLFIEASGGTSVDAIQSILKYRENKAFEFRFSNRRVSFFVGEFSRPGSDESYIVVVLLKDGDFERMFLRLMIEDHVNEKKFKNRVQMFFGSNNLSGGGYFRTASIPDPWFDYAVAGKETVSLGRLSEPTRFSGVSVKDTVVLEKNSRKCLYFSFKPSNLDMHTVVTLYDYSEINNSLVQLRIFIMVSFLVSLLIGYILAKIMARSLIEPVSLLRCGVEQVESGNYRTRLIMPGEDELVELAESFNAMTQGLDERERMTRYLSKSAVNAVVKGEDAFMGGKRVPATILFSDIRSFTTISESNTAEEVVKLLNDYFAVMNQVVEEHGGDIDKFIGDAIMAQFIVAENTGETPAKLAFNAVKCALAMMHALDEFNVARSQRGLFPVKIGVGINSGDVIAGNIGSPGRMDRTVIGDTVNVASRLEGMSKLGRHTFVIISRSTLELIKDLVVVEQLSETSVKGKTSVVEMFEVIAIKGYN
ncbi:MAG: hypothetical protein ACD_39C01511G0002 [uncultured bacterium]|nr:MAG: hypothetical protein ACD_39C01511G0002 [uncultured bacterium]